MNNMIKLFLDSVEKKGLYEALMYHWEMFRHFSLAMKDVNPTPINNRDAPPFVSTLTDGELLLCALTEEASHGLVAQLPIRMLIDRNLSINWWKWALDEGGGAKFISESHPEYRRSISQYLWNTVKSEEDQRWLIELLGKKESCFTTS